MPAYTKLFTLLAFSATTLASTNPKAIGPLFVPAWNGDSNSTILNTLADSACVYIATDPNWSGDKSWGCSPPTLCQNMAPEFQNQVSAFGPDQGAGMCSLFEAADCSGAASQGIWYPGIADLGTIGWDNRARSVVCDGV